MNLFLVGALLLATLTTLALGYINMERDVGTIDPLALFTSTLMVLGAIPIFILLPTLVALNYIQINPITLLVLQSGLIGMAITIHRLA